MTTDRELFLFKKFNNFLFRLARIAKWRMAKEERREARLS